jgi:hypothetical protein
MELNLSLVETPVISSKNNRNAISDEDFKIITALDSLKRELDLIHNHLDSVTDPVLIDSFIYETMAINTRYTYYLKLCKAKGLIASGY